MIDSEGKSRDIKRNRIHKAVVKRTTSRGTCFVRHSIVRRSFLVCNSSSRYNVQKALHIAISLSPSVSFLSTRRVSVYSHMAYGVLLFSRLPIDAQREFVSRIPSLISSEMLIFFNRHNLCFFPSRAAEDDDRRNYNRLNRPIF